MAMLHVTVKNITLDKLEMSTEGIRFGTVFEATIHDVSSIYLMSAAHVVDLRAPGRIVCVLKYPYPMALNYRESLTADLSVTF